MIFVVLRIAIGCFFVASGFQKLIEPYENFLYVIEGYQIMGTVPADLVARFLPWMEFFLGVFLVMGLWLKWVLRALWFLLMIFIVTAGQAIVRKLPIHDCGCFGGLFSVPLQIIILFDSTLLVLVAVLLVSRKTSLFSLDKHFK